MSKLRIFIEGKELDTLDSVSVPITKQFEELSDPTVICNDYSKTVTVPLSKNNNDIFGHCYIPDRLISVNEDDTIPAVGLYFDPFKKLVCRLQWGNDVFFTGYAKMLKVTNSGYELTINGELGKIFQELQKITFDKTKYDDDSDIEKYWIDGSKYVDTTINKDLVYKCWNSTQDDFTLRETTDSNYDITDIIGFIPNNSYSNDFDYKTLELADGTAQTMEDILSEDFETNSGYTRDSVIGDGLLPIQTMQFRSYEQIPFIYWNKFWQIFAKKSYELTGYEWDYSDSFFNNNLNYENLAVTLLQRDAMNAVSDIKSDSSLSISTVQKQYYLSSKHSNIELNIVNDDNKNGYEIKYKSKPYFVLQFSNTTNKVGFTCLDSVYGGLIVTYKSTDSVGTTTLFRVGFCSDSNSNALKYLQQFYNLDYYQTISDVSVSDNIAKLVLSINDDVYGVTRTKGSDTVLSVEFDYVMYNTTNIMTNWGIYSPIYEATDIEYSYLANFTLLNTNLDTSLIYYKTLFRSNDEFTLNDICNFDFTNILDYCKRFRINIYVDELNKKLVFTTHYFTNYDIVDKTNDVDRSTQFDIEVPSFDHKYVNFGYKESDSLIGSSYKKVYASYPYGAKRLQTRYQFNDDVKTLFEKSFETILYSPAYLYWQDLYAKSIDKTYPLSFWTYNNKFLECRDSDNKTLDCSFAYFFPTKTKIDVESSVVYITDDSNKQKLLNTYYNYLSGTGSLTSYWTSPELVIRVPQVYPYKYHTCLFEKPKTNYTVENDYYDKITSTTYSVFWNSYISERYNTQNKKVTTYIRISPLEFTNFKFNQFWKIGNQLYIVNKIYDYDITSDQPTKVDLLTIQNILSYQN